MASIVIINLMQRDFLLHYIMKMMNFIILQEFVRFILFDLNFKLVLGMYANS